MRRKDCGPLRMTTQMARTSDEYGVIIRQFMANSGFEPKDVEDVVIASVVPNMMYSFINAIKIFPGNAYCRWARH